MCRRKARHLHAQQLNALAVQDLLDLVGGLGVDPAGNADHGGLLVQPGKAAAFHDAGAVDRAQDRHAQIGQRSGCRLLFAPAYAWAQPADNGAAINGDHCVTRIAALHAILGALVQHDNSDLVFFQYLDQGIVLGLHGGQVRRRGTAPVPTGFGVTISTQIFNLFRRDQRY